MGQPDARQANSDEMRKQGIVDRLTSGTNSRVTQMSDKHFEKFVRHNSVGRHCEAELREKRAESKPSDSSSFGPVTSLGTPIGARAQSIKRAQSKETSQNMQPDEKKELARTDSKKLPSRLAQMNDEQFEKFVRQPSVGGRREAGLRESRALNK